MADVTELLDKRGCYATNVRKDQGLDHLFAPTAALVCRSDCDSQMILHFCFNGRVRLTGLVFQAPEDFPTTVKLYTNRSAFGFDDVDAVTPTQAFENLTEKSFGTDVITKLQPTKFNNVDNVFIFCDREGADTSALSGIKFIGQAMDTADLTKLQKVGHMDGE